MLTAMKLSDVQKQTGVMLTYEQAIRYANPNGALRNMAIALSQLTWRNSPEDWLRLQSALVILNHKRPSNKR